MSVNILLMWVINKWSHDDVRGWVWVKESDGLGEETPPKSLSFCHQAAEALTRWQQSEKTVTRVIWVFDDFDSSASAAFEVDVPAERGEQTLRCAQLSAQLSARLCSLHWSCFHTTLRCTESIYFLWSLNRKFSRLLVRPWISSAVADGTAFAWLS